MADNIVWPTFQDLSFDQQESAQIEVEPIVKDVLENFRIPYSDVESGKLLNVDLKRVAPLEAMRASLLELFAEDGELREIAVNAHGEVYTYRVGSRRSFLDVYYTIKSSGYRPKEVNVMVTGGKPRVRRVVTDFIPIIGQGADDTWYTIWDTNRLTSNCKLPGFSSSAVITYKDPILTTGKTSFKDGIDNLVELDNPFQTILGWAWLVEVGSEAMNSMVNIVQQNQSSVPILISGYNIVDGELTYPNIGVPRRRGIINANGENQDCFLFEDAPEDITGRPIVLSIPIKEGLTYTYERGTIVNKFMGINQLYVVGISLDICKGVPRPDITTFVNNKENTVVVVGTADNNVVKNVYKLDPGIHYVEIYDEDNVDNPLSVVNIQFANNSRPKDYGFYGTGVPFYVEQNSLALAEYLGVATTSQGLIQTRGTLLPVNNDGTGILVDQVWAQIDLDTPCFVVSDPQGNALDIAKSLSVKIAPIIVEDQPPPIAMNGMLIDQAAGMGDNDPTTATDFEETPMELANKSMKGRTLSISLASLDEEATRRLSGNLQELLAEDAGISYTHTCGPDSVPELGTIGPNGHIINSITYSYNDGGSYLITVVEGAKAYGNFSGLSGGIYQKQVEDITAVGTVVQQLGDHINYKVRVDGYGTVLAINCYPGVIDIRDRVNVTIHNNAVEA